MVYDYNRTSKRLTYFLIIRQLRFDNYDAIASKLERVYLNNLGNLDLTDLHQSDDLQRIVAANAICADLIASTKSSLECVTRCSFTKAADENQTRKPNSVLSGQDDLFDVSQISACSPSSLPTESSLNIINNFHDAISGDSIHSTKLTVFRRGRALPTPTTSTPEPVVNPPSGELVTELQSTSRGLVPETEVHRTPKSSSSSEHSDTADSLYTNTSDEGNKEDQELSLQETETSVNTKPSAAYGQIENSFMNISSALSVTKTAEDCDNVESTDLLGVPPLGKVHYYRFSDYGNPAEFANRPQCTPNAAAATRTKTPDHQVPSTSGSVQSNAVDSSSNRNLSYRLNTDPELLYLDTADKCAVLSILREGWKGQPTFERRVKKEIPRTNINSTEEILYAVFGYVASDFVEFKMNEKNRLQIRLKHLFDCEPYDNEAILSLVCNN